MKSEFALAFNEILETRALPREVVMEALTSALVSAYRRDVSVSSAQRVEARIDPLTGQPTILVEKEVVDDVHDERTEVRLDVARTLEPEATLGMTVMVPVSDTTRNFGRIAAQTAKQVILQKIREAEREALYEEYIEREGDLLSGTVQSVSAQGVTLSLGRTEALLPREQMMPGERYKPHEKVRAYVLAVKKSSRGPQIIVSRSHRNMLRRLLEYEVPEIYNGQVEIKNIAREAGYRSKVAVAALQDGVDPVGACVGMRGIRIQNIVRELNDEKIDVIEWSPEPAVFITKALSPARVSGVYLDEDPDSGRGSIGTATVIVPDDQLSLAIGREGQNARLAAKLTGWRIDIKSVTEAAITALAVEDSPDLAAMHTAQAELVAEVRRILSKREAGRPVMPEEFQTLIQYVKLAEQALLESRKTVRQKRQARLQVARQSFPPRAFEVPVTALPLPEAILEPLSRFGTVGELMSRLQVDEDQVAQVFQDMPKDTLTQVKAVLETFELPEPAPVVIEEAVPAPEPEPVAVAAEAAAAVAPVVEEVAPAEAPEVVEEIEEAPPAIIEPEPPPAPVVTPPPPPRPQPLKPAAPKPVPPKAAVVLSPEPEEEGGERVEGQRKKKSKQRRRQLVYDEDLDEVVVRRKRKGSRKREFWDDDEGI